MGRNSSGILAPGPQLPQPHLPARGASQACKRLEPPPSPAYSGPSQAPAAGMATSQVCPSPTGQPTLLGQVRSPSPSSSAEALAPSLPVLSGPVHLPFPVLGASPHYFSECSSSMCPVSAKHGHARGPSWMSVAEADPFALCLSACQLTVFGEPWSAGSLSVSHTH